MCRHLSERILGLAVQALEMYAGAGKWAAAHKVAMGYLPEQEVKVSSSALLCISCLVQIPTNPMHAEPAESAEPSGFVAVFLEADEHPMPCYAIPCHAMLCYSLLRSDCSSV